jgi:hypothetical protein
MDTRMVRRAMLQPGLMTAKGEAVVTRRKGISISISILVMVGAVLYADWRMWLPWPKLLHYRYANFDRFQIYGKAPWCFLLNSKEDSADCHYLSQQHCGLANAPFMNMSEPEDRGVCVPNPLNSRADAGRAPIVTVAPND